LFPWLSKGFFPEVGTEPEERFEHRPYNTTPHSQMAALWWMIWRPSLL